jgi:hypothetical protein
MSLTENFNPAMCQQFRKKVHSAAVVLVSACLGCVIGALVLFLETRLIYGFFPQSQLDSIHKAGNLQPYFAKLALWLDLHVLSWLLPQLILDEPDSPWFFKFGAYATAVCFMGMMLGGVIGWATSLHFLRSDVLCGRVCWFGGWWAAIVTVFLLIDYANAVPLTGNSLVSILLFVQLFIGQAMLICHGSKLLKKHGLLDN